MKITGAEIVIRILQEKGVDTIFGYPGGAVLNIYDELYKASDRIKHYTTCHEQGAAHAADAYARVTGKVGVVLATSGPGATNLVTGIANAYLDSSPIVAITGNVPCPAIGKDSFQEVDITGVTMPITKHNYIVKDVTRLASALREAFEIAARGRPGPVLVDIPKDIQQAECEYEPLDAAAPQPQPYKNGKEAFAQAVKLIRECKRPYIYTGGGTVCSNASKELLALAEKNLQDVLAKRARKLSRTVGACEELAKALGLASRPRRIEGYDISNTQGAQSVASMVVMIDGVIQPAQYRHFRIKTVTGANDFASMHEVITRRLSRGLRERQDRLDQGLDPAGGSFSHLPDLILIDGGAGQLAFARDAMKGLGLDIPMFGLAKRLEEIILPEQEESILLDRRSDALHLIQRLRDEAHRFGIAHHRKLRARKSAASVLDGIPGVGPVRKKALLKHFKTIEELKKADQEQLSAVEGVGPGLARVIAGYFRENAPGGGSSGRP